MNSTTNDEYKDALELLKGSIPMDNAKTNYDPNNNDKPVERNVLDVVNPENIGRVDRLNNLLSEMNNEQDDFDSRLDVFDNKLDGLTGQVEELESNDLESRVTDLEMVDVNDLETRVDSLENVESIVEDLDSRMYALEATDFSNIEERVDSLEMLTTLDDLGILEEDDIRDLAREAISTFFKEDPLGRDIMEAFSNLQKEV